MNIFSKLFGGKRKALVASLNAELAHIKSAMPIAVRERDRLKKNKKRHAYLDDLIKEHRTRQLEIEMALKG